MATIQHRLGQVQAELNNLVSVLKQMGTAALTSVSNELPRLETEREKLRSELKKLARVESGLTGIGALGRKFLETWRHVGQIIEHAEPQELLRLIRHFVEVVEWAATSPDGRVGRYTLRLFSEAVKERQDPAEEVAPETAGGPAEGGTLLSPDADRLQEVEKAPRVGLEPTTCRLTAGRSTD
jgi:hypothetical protein